MNKVSISLPKGQGFHLKAGQVFVDGNGRRFQSTQVQHVIGGGQAQTRVSAVEIPRHVPPRISPRMKTYTQAIRTLLKLGVAHDTVLVCIDNRTNSTNRIHIAEIDTALPHWGNVHGRPRNDADFIRRCHDPSTHPNVEFKLGHILAQRKGSSAIRRLANDLAREGFTVMRITKNLKRNVGFHVRTCGKRYRLRPITRV